MTTEKPLKKKRRTRDEQIADIKAAQALDLKRADARLQAEEGRKHVSARRYAEAAKCFTAAATLATELQASVAPKGDVIDAEFEDDTKAAE